MKDSWEAKLTQIRGRGIFAKKKIRAGTVISDYLGTVIKTANYDLKKDSQGLYLMYCSDTASIYPNLSVPGPHTINHSCHPNCWISIYRGHSLFFAWRKIMPGEELTISYLLDPNEGTCRSCTHICRCESANCSDTMHLSNSKYDAWQSFQNNERGKTKRARIIFGKKLGKLPSYPHMIPGHAIYKKIML